MAGQNEQYRIEEGGDFSRSLEELAAREGIDKKYFDRALTAVWNALSEAPYTFPVVPPLTHIRVAKTWLYMDEDNVIVPPLRIWFSILEDDRVVLLRIIEKRGGFGLD